MKLQKNVIYADPAMNGYQLRNALRERGLSTKFQSLTHNDRIPPRKVALSEEEEYFRSVAERQGYAVDQVQVTNAGQILIRTKF